MTHRIHSWQKPKPIYKMFFYRLHQQVCKGSFLSRKSSGTWVPIANDNAFHFLAHDFLSAKYPKLHLPQGCHNQKKSWKSRSSVDSDFTYELFPRYYIALAILISSSSVLFANLKFGFSSLSPCRLGNRSRVCSAMMGKQKQFSFINLKIMIVIVT